MVFDLKADYKPNATVIQIGGDLAIDSVDRLDAAVRDALMKSGNPIILDMKGLDFVDSKGAGFLLKLKEKVNGRQIVLAEVSPSVNNVLQRLSVSEHYKIHRTLEEALKRF